jgi:hypothetical protein
MELYWKNRRIAAGTLLEVREQGNELLDTEGRLIRRIWEIIEIRARTEDEAYYDPKKKRTYSMRQVMGKRRLRRMQEAGEFVQIPASSEYLVIKEYHTDFFSGFRCFSVDMLGLLSEVKFIEKETMRHPW